MKTISDSVEKYRELILEAERYIWAHPETGYKEFETTKYLAEKFEELGYKLTYADGITGFYTVIDTGREGPEVLILGELDSIICPAHKDANPITGAVHSCGHNAQCAALLGVAAALTDKDVLAKLCGRVRLCAVPAEELLEIEYRSELKKQGKIKYFGGKSEFLHRGYFDGVDIAFMVHTATTYGVNNGSVGCIAKNIIYKGVAAHAGGAPWCGINALYAANCGLNAVNALRETFKEEDLIRVHPIITSGGDMVNAIPEIVRMESYVRGKTFEAIASANKKVNRALTGAALSMGANIEIIDIPGYSPLVNDRNMIELAKDALELTDSSIEFHMNNRTGTGSTDMGDLSSIMPVIHPYAAGAEGNSHGNNYEIVDPIAACVTNAKWQTAMLMLLLENNAERAKKIIAEFKPLFASKDDFLAYQDSLNDSGDRITYNESGTADYKALKMKIAIIGYSGGGKSTLAGNIGKRQNIPVLYLDTVHWLPGWKEQKREEEIKIVGSFLDSNDNWVIDGNYSKIHFDRRMKEADMIVFICFNRFASLARAIRRYKKYKGSTRDSMTEGCPEKIDFNFAKWILWDGRRKKVSGKYKETVKKYADKSYIIKNQKQLDDLYCLLGLND